jgi:phosphatidylserine/phosphatidylglycerophosphate/cardiolipin synthase-like enzyme
MSTIFFIFMKIFFLPVWLLTLLVFSPSAKALNFQHETLEYSVCFTPGGTCTQDIINMLNSAKKQVLVQAYQLTSAPIADALVQAHRRGVDVEVILDKTQVSNKRGQLCSPAKCLLEQGIPIWIDRKPAIAHNKVMVIDEQIVMTGSFNFSKGAQLRNAENLLILEDEAIAKAYSGNWHKRLDASVRFTGNRLVG